ncbi:hypothetical protein FOPG_18971 [Fusarium oxysporum f. sp. conglutinans race 2 54008]|uniref:Secreted protein n=1 Tax=Fusarium oxysporum f. sp. conglutinans race 2 54008 TaxID=1089457 RepID=X0HUF5_FUSOX|nr:hypothetical protein FOPG_18971 [Fusarium oxysporum f. sp. conglutinans race 2 54008]KAI8397198.1 hypothetical protein FOFC_20470 [Fusarium oxysporum]
MNSLIWIWLHALASAACDVNYALWSPGFGMTVINDLIPALPEVGVKEFENINGGIDANNIGKGGTYTVPYGSEMTINKPAKWSGDCPKTLLLRGEETTQKTPTPSEQPTLSTLTQENTNTPMAASGTVPDHTTTRPAGTHKVADLSDSKSSGQATDTETPTPGKTGSKKPTGTGTGAASPTATPWTCWPKGSQFSVTSSKEIRDKAVNDFCAKLKGEPLTPKNHYSVLQQQNLTLSGYLKPECNSEINKAVCLRYFEVIEALCYGYGGSFQDGCASVWMQTPKQ